MDSHLEMIQTTIARMSNHSFLLKGWSATLASGLLALTTEKDYLLAFLPAIAFWLLDAYFLRQERLFRGLYDRELTSRSLKD
jgi:hypothetical protein